MLKIRMKNESAKHYVSLDRDDISCYPDEKEILIQAGIKAKILSVEKETIEYDVISCFVCLFLIF